MQIKWVFDEIFGITAHNLSIPCEHSSETTPLYIVTHYIPKCSGEFNQKCFVFNKCPQK